jgi:predicted aspartyl protease
VVTFSAPRTLRLTSEPVPIVPCTLAGRAVRCLLDTGTQPSAIALPLAEALGLEPRGELELAGFGRFLTGMIESGPLSIGAAQFDHLRFAVLPSTAGVAFDVVVGSDLLGRVRLILDRRRGSAQVTAPSSASTADAIALRVRAGRPHIAAMLDGAGVDALFDSGDQAAVSIGYAAYRLGTQWPIAGRGIAKGIAGTDDFLRVTIPEVRIGAFSLGRTEATVRRTQEEAHVGIGLWERCLVELDELNGRLRCTPYER